MPLEHANTKEAFKHDIKAEIAAGKPKKQAIAISYQATGKDGAAGILYRAGDKILLMKRAEGKTQGGKWSFPAGKIEDGENAQGAAMREFREETGHSVVGGVTMMHENKEFTLFQHRGEQFVPQLNDEHTDYKWADANNLPEPLHPGVKNSINWPNGMDGADPSQQDHDQNGFITIESNPISRSGVFQYLGRSIDPDAEPEKIYNVYRPAAELDNLDALESFKLIPFVDNHTMLGDKEKGMMPAEMKGVHGSTGEKVEFKDGVLYATIKIFSQYLKNMIQDGKRALSLGYWCKFTKQQGIHNGTPYDYVQTNLRGNHLALVDAARCDVAVLDSRMAFDHFDLIIDSKETQMADEERMKKVEDAVAKICDWMEKTTAKDAEEEKKKKEAEDAVTAERQAGGKLATDEEKEKEKKEAEDKKAKDAEEAEKKKEKEEGMDAAIKSLNTQVETLTKDGLKTIQRQVTARNKLYDQLSPFVGAFDHAEMTESEVAAYGVKKLGLSCAAGQELVALTGFLHNRKPDTTGFAIDTSQTSGKGLWKDTKAKKTA